MALLVTGDFEVPLFHHLYPGNHNDPTSFRAVIHELLERYRPLSKRAEDVTIVFDKGNNTEDTIEVVGKKYHIVGSLVPTYHSDLLAIKKTRFRRLDCKRFPNEVTSYRTTKEVFGRTFTVLVTYNENLFSAQTQTIEREVAKLQGKLQAYQLVLGKWHRGRDRGKRPSVASAKKKVANILRGQHVKGLFVVDVSERPDGLPAVHYRFDRRAYERLQRTQLGKTILFTDNAHWSDEDIVTAYRGQHTRNVSDPATLASLPGGRNYVGSARTITSPDF